MHVLPHCPMRGLRTADCGLRIRPVTRGRTLSRFTAEDIPDDITFPSHRKLMIDVWRQQAESA